MSEVKASIAIHEDGLPVLSVVATQAMEAMRRPDVSNEKLNDLIRQDPALTSRVLQISNSPFYGSRVRIETIPSAILRLGMRQLRNVIVAAATGELFDASDANVRALWNHAMISAYASDRLAAGIDMSLTEEAFVAGLLHDVGKLVIYHQLPQIYGKLLEDARAANRSICEMEDETFEYFNHVTIGGLAIRKWKMSDTVAEVVRFHHSCSDHIPPIVNAKQLLAIVCLVNAIINRFEAGTPPEATSFDGFFPAEFLRLKPAQIQDVIQSVQELTEAQSEQ